MFIRILFLTASLLSMGVSVGQSSFKDIELDLAFDCDVMVNAFESRHRAHAGEKFNQKFMDALRQTGSFDYPFDSLKWISKKAPENNLFRIFTWEIKVAEGDYKYYGCIQTKEGKVIVLTDAFKEAEDVAIEEFTPDNWLGAVYYNLMEMKPTNGDPYYLLFGVNRWSAFENKKLVDVLFFSKDGKAIFGKETFKKSEAGEVDVFYNRLVFTYAADGQMTVNYNPGMEMIVYDNLIPRMSRIPGYGQTLVPDGSYVGYVWDKKYWNRVDKIATQVMDTAPRPNPILDKRKGKKIMGN